MYHFGTRVLKITSPSLVIIIVAAATSVCGVSAAIAVAAAARAKKDELTLAVGMMLIFRVLMMILMPIGIRVIGMDLIVGGAESNMRELMDHVQGGRPIQLYLVGQTFNVVLTLAAAYLAFGGIL